MEKREFKYVCADILQEYNLTQTQFAKAIGTTQATVSFWLNGKQEPRYFQLQNIAEKYDIDLDFLLGLVK